MSSQPKNEKREFFSPIFLSQHPPPSQSCPAEGTWGMRLPPTLACSWCLAQLAAGGREKSQPQLDNAQKIFSKPPNFAEKSVISGDLLPALSPMSFTSLFLSPFFRLVEAQGGGTHGWAVGMLRVLTEVPSTTPGFCWAWAYPALLSDSGEVSAKFWLMTGLVLS